MLHRKAFEACKLQFSTSDSKLTNAILNEALGFQHLAPARKAHCEVNPENQSF